MEVRYKASDNQIVVVAVLVVAIVVVAISFDIISCQLRWKLLWPSVSLSGTQLD